MGVMLGDGEAAQALLPSLHCSPRSATSGPGWGLPHPRRGAGGRNRPHPHTCSVPGPPYTVLGPHSRYWDPTPHIGTPHPVLTRYGGWEATCMFRMTPVLCVLAPKVGVPHSPLCPPADQ